MTSTIRTFLSLTEIEPRIVPDATATLLPETFGTTSTTTSTTLQYVDDPAHPVTATTLGFTDDPAHPITATPASVAIPPTTTTTTTPPTSSAPAAVATEEVLELPPEFLAWIETLSDEEIQNLLALSDAELGALIAGTSAPESSAVPVDGLPTADTTPTLHGINVGTSPPPTATNPNVVNTVFHIDPNAPPPTATTLEFTNGQQHGPLVTTLQNPVQPPPMTPEDALNRLQNRPQIVVDSSTPPVVQAAAPPGVLLVDTATPIIAAGGTIPGGDQMIYWQYADGTYHPYMTTSMLADMIRRGNAGSSGATPGWTLGATFGEISNVVAHLPNIDYTPVIKLYLQGVALPFAPGLVLQPVINSAINNVGSIYNDQRNSEHIASSVVTTLAYSIVSVVGLVDVHEAIGGREARSGRELTSMERWSRGLIGFGTFLLSALPFAPSSRAAPAVAGETAEAAAARAALEADVRAGLQAVQAERRAAALGRSQRQAMMPERPAGPPGEGPVPRPEPVPPRIETPTPAERPVVPRPEPVPPPVEAPVPGNSSAHVDIGGEGRYPDATNVNPSPVTSTTGQAGRPIPNRVAGTGENLPQANQSVDLITVENTPISPGTAAEIARVIRPGGVIRLVGPADYAQVAHQRVIQSMPPGATVTQTTVGTGETAITTTIITLP